MAASRTAVSTITAGSTSVGSMGQGRFQSIVAGLSKKNAALGLMEVQKSVSAASHSARSSSPSSTGIQRIVWQYPVPLALRLVRVAGLARVIALGMSRDGDVPRADACGRRSLEIVHRDLVGQNESNA